MSLRRFASLSVLVLFVLVSCAGPSLRNVSVRRLRVQAAGDSGAALAGLEAAFVVDRWKVRDVVQKRWNGKTVDEVGEERILRDAARREIEGRVREAGWLGVTRDAGSMDFLVRMAVDFEAFHRAEQWKAFLVINVYTLGLGWLLGLPTRMDTVEATCSFEVFLPDGSRVLRDSFVYDESWSRGMWRSGRRYREPYADFLGEALEFLVVALEQQVGRDRLDARGRGVRLVADRHATSDQMAFVAQAPLAPRNEDVRPVAGVPVAERREPAPAQRPVPRALPVLGRFHALVIGNQDYRNHARLRTPVRDARAVAELLRELYGFEVTVLENATGARIRQALFALEERVGAGDSLLLYFAGHGSLDAGEGYWLGVDAGESPADWISNSTLQQAVRRLESARHVLVVSDSCFSGSLTRATRTGPTRDERGVEVVGGTGPERLWSLSGRKARLVLTSGGEEPVEDGGPGGHSVFANAFLSALRRASSTMEGYTLFPEIRAYVRANARGGQEPAYSPLRACGHEFGDFLFVRRDGGR